MKKKSKNILFVYPNQTGQLTNQVGIGYLSAILKKEGHKTSLFDTTYFLYEKFKVIKEKLFSKIEDFQPDLIAFSCRSLEFSIAKKMAEAIKTKYKIKIIFGGIHPTIQPEKVLKSKAMDYICVGEGEKAILELVNNLNSKKRINNIWTKKIKTPLNPPIQDLDSIPFPDREIFNIPDENNNLILTSRGCPFNCSYCYNHALKRLYKGHKFIRFRKIDDVVREAKELVKKHKIKYIYFCDDLFTSNKKRILEFCEKYDIKFPFVCNGRIEDIDKEVATALKKANCIEVRIGIESGNEKLRTDILRRYYSNEQIKKAFQTCKEVGLKTYSFNMIGLPFETKETILQTFKLIRETSDNFQVSILYPFEGTDIYKIYEENNYFKDKKLSQKEMKTFLDKSRATFSNLSQRQLIAYQRFSKLYVKYPKLHPLINLVKILPLEKIDIFKNKTLAKLYLSIKRRKLGSSMISILKEKKNIK